MPDRWSSVRDLAPEELRRVTRLETFADEFSRDLRLEMERERIKIQLTPLQAWAVLDYVVLALRHFDEPGPLDAAARSVAAQLASELAVTPALRRFVHRALTEDL